MVCCCSLVTPSYISILEGQSHHPRASCALAFLSRGLASETFAMAFGQCLSLFPSGEVRASALRAGSEGEMKGCLENLDSSAPWPHHSHSHIRTIICLQDSWISLGLLCVLTTWFMSTVQPDWTLVETRKLWKGMPSGGGLCPQCGELGLVDRLSSGRWMCRALE